MKRILIIAALIAAVACNPFDIEEVLLPREDISLTVKGKVEFAYDPLTCQMSQNVKTNEYRVFDDKLSGWFILKCGEMPVDVGQELNADLTWTASKSTKTMNGLTFTVEKASPDGKIWMWCKKKSIGIVIKNL